MAATDTEIYNCNGCRKFNSDAADSGNLDGQITRTIKTPDGESETYTLCTTHKDMQGGKTPNREASTDGEWVWTSGLAESDINLGVLARAHTSKDIAALYGYTQEEVMYFDPEYNIAAKEAKVEREAFANTLVDRMDVIAKSLENTLSPWEIEFSYMDIRSAMVFQGGGRSERSTCKKCSQPIAKYDSGWRHIKGGPNGGTNIKCPNGEGEATPIKEVSVTASVEYAPVIGDLVSNPHPGKNGLPEITTVADVQAIGDDGIHVVETSADDIFAVVENPTHFDSDWHIIARLADVWGTTPQHPYPSIPPGYAHEHFVDTLWTPSMNAHAHWDGPKDKKPYNLQAAHLVPGQLVNPLMNSTEASHYVVGLGNSPTPGVTLTTLRDLSTGENSHHVIPNDAYLSGYDNDGYNHWQPGMAPPTKGKK